jgi:DNA-binding CsgD family transcriptional regulator
MRAAPTQPGLIVVDSSLAVVACNGEALRILTFPDPPDKIRHLGNWLAHKIRTELLGHHSPPKFVDGFRSAKRMYLCRSFLLDLRADHINGLGNSSGLLIVMLERRSNEVTQLNEMSERFGLTVREQETVKYLREGLTSKEIAHQMKISPNTVKAFLRLVMVKMSVSTRSGIIGRIAGPGT